MIGPILLIIKCFNKILVLLAPKTKAAKENAVWPQFLNGLAFIQHLARTGRRCAANGHQGGAFARPVGSDESDDFPFADGQVHVAQGLNIAVEGIDAAQLKHDPPRPGRL